jgi:signal transduction histidine kinase
VSLAKYESAREQLPVVPIGGPVLAVPGSRWNTIRWRLILGNLLAICLPLLALVGVTGALLWHFYLTVMTDSLRARAAIIADLAAPVLDPSTPDNPIFMDRLVAQWEANSSTLVTLVDGSGLVEGGPPSWMGKKLDPAYRPGMLKALQDGMPDSGIWEPRHFNYEESLYYNLPVSRDGRVVGVVQTALSLAKVRTSLSEIVGLLLVAVLMYAALVVGLTLWFGISITSPIERLISGVRRLAAGDLGERFNEQGTAEIRVLGSTLNAMATRLGQLESLRRQYVSDVSHDLRTPLGSIRALADTVLEHGDEDPELRHRYLTRIIAQTERLSRLASQLVELSVVEGGQVLGSVSPVDVEAVVSVALQEIAPRAMDAHIELRLLSNGEPVLVIGDRDRLVRALLNLLDNAIRYTRPGGQIDISVEAEPGKARIQVSDNGCGIPAADLEHIFDRFYRVEKSRSVQTGGAGLGLAIVRRIVESYGGRIEVESRLQEGTRFTVVLPRAGEN